MMTERMTEATPQVEPEKEDEREKLPFVGVRHVQVLLLFFLLAIGIAMRGQLSVAIVAMTDETVNSNSNVPVYNWRNKGVILSSFYWGYLSLQIIAGTLGKMYGVKILLACAMALNSTANFLVPLTAAKLGFYGVMICRILQGVTQGFFFPSVYNLLATWIPVKERARLSTAALTGYTLGNIMASSLVGYICSTSLGWPFSFYLFGGFGYVWVVVWIVYGASRPSDHRSITNAERMFIEQDLPESKEITLKKIPWLSIFTSAPVWALIVISTGINWGGTTLSTELATYMDKILKYDIKTNGFLITTAPVATFITSFFFAYVADYVVNKHILSIGVTRKIFTVIGCVIPAGTLIVLGFLPQNMGIFSVITLIINGIFQGALHGGHSVNHMDLSPNYVGIIMAATNSISSGISMLAPVAVQFIVTDEYDKSQWRTVFLIAAIVYVASITIYVFFGSGEVQKWNGNEGDEEMKYEDREMERKISRKVSSIMSNP